MAKRRCLRRAKARGKSSKGRCMKWASSSSLGGTRKKGRRKKSGAKKTCLTTKGKLKKGWRLAKGGRCVAARG